MHIEMDPIAEAVITPPREGGLDNMGGDLADIAQRMHENGMKPTEILGRLPDIPPVL